MIVVTGAAGFIASYLIGKLNELGFTAVVAVDDFSNAAKAPNLEGKALAAKVHRNDFLTWLEENQERVEFVFHLGARTDTAETNVALFNDLNLHYSQEVWRACTQYQLPLVYASSAATYGLGEHGYEDDTSRIPLLSPLNAYGRSKQAFDEWVLAQTAQEQAGQAPLREPLQSPFFWAGLKFFNVYGPNEYHKGRMASVVYHTFKQVSATDQMRLFRSHHKDYKDGEQMRDFVFVDDVAEVCLFLMKTRRHSGIYNMGSGKARTFYDLASGVFNAMGKKVNIDFVDTPADIRDKYQYFTEASMQKIRDIGYDAPFRTLEQGIEIYVQQYLMRGMKPF